MFLWICLMFCCSSPLSSLALVSPMCLRDAMASWTAWNPGKYNSGDHLQIAVGALILWQKCMLDISSIMHQLPSVRHRNLKENLRVNVMYYCTVCLKAGGYNECAFHWWVCLLSLTWYFVRNAWKMTKSIRNISKLSSWKEIDILINAKFAMVEDTQQACLYIKLQMIPKDWFTPNLSHAFNFHFNFLSKQPGKPPQER